MSESRRFNQRARRSESARFSSGPPIRSVCPTIDAWRCKRAREDRLQCFRDGRSLVLLRISQDAVPPPPPLCRRSIGVSSGVTTRAGVHGSGGHPRTHVSSPSKNVRCSLRPGKPEVMRQTGFGKPCARKPSTRLAFGFLDPRSLLYYILLN